MANRAFIRNETIYCRFTREAFVVDNCDGCVVTLTDGTTRPIGEFTHILISSDETKARTLGWVTTRERYGNDAEGYGIVHPCGHWVPDWHSAAAFPNPEQPPQLIEGARAGIIEALGGMNARGA